MGPNGQREDLQVTLPNGEQATLQKVKISVRGYVVVEVSNNTTDCFSEPIEFNSCAAILLCAPEGTQLVCRVTDVSCNVGVNCADGVFNSLEICLNLCQDIQTVNNTVVELPAQFCTPRETMDVPPCRFVIPEDCTVTPSFTQKETHAPEECPKQEIRNISPAQTEDICVTVPMVYDWLTQEQSIQIRRNESDLIFNCPAPFPRCVQPSCEWVEDPNNPIFNPPTDAYYQTVRYSSTKFNADGTPAFYKMWYDYAGAGGIALANSPDGINWSIEGTTSGLKSTARHSRVLYDPDGFGQGTPYRIWYWDSEFINFSACNSATTICMIRTASSVDGINWIQDTETIQDASNPLFANAGSNAGSFGPADILYYPENPSTLDLTEPFNNKYVMYYSVVASGSPRFEQIALAVSNDGINWSKVGPEVVLPHGNPGDWDYYYATVGAVVVQLAPNNFVMWYSGGFEQSYQGIGCATSTDGINWTKNPNNPVFDVDDNVAWRNRRTYNPWVLYDRFRFSGHGDLVCYKFWMTGAPNPSDKKSIGYATNEAE